MAVARTQGAMQSVHALKSELAALGAATEVGFRASAADAARIKALAAELETQNPTSDPAQASALLRGRWQLLYSNLGLKRETTLAELSFNILPRTDVEVMELYNEVDPANGHYDNVIHLLFADGTPGQQVMLGDYATEDGDAIDIAFTGALVTGGGAPVKLPVDHGRLPAITNRITYLDEGFRLVRGSFGSLYVLERLDPAPMRWARDI